MNKPKLRVLPAGRLLAQREPLPTSFWTEEIDVIALPKADGIGSQLPAARGNIGYIGPVPERALGLDIPADKLNPKGVLDYLHYYRAYKTDYESFTACVKRKNGGEWPPCGARRFQSGASEFDINQAYLTATGHRDTDVPYSNIVALNEHASVLHYTKLDHQVPADAQLPAGRGAEYNGYAADLTPYLGGECGHRFGAIDQRRERRTAGADWHHEGRNQLRGLSHPVPSAHR